MDAGYLNNKAGCIFCKDSFSIEGIARLKIALKEKQTIPSSYRIYIDVENCKTFVLLIKPYL